VWLKVRDNVTTDDILPGGSQILPLRSNLPAISQYAFTRLDPDFPRRVQGRGEGAVVGGENYGQGSSREHAALAPMYLGIKGVIVKSFARIHRANLINFGILPLEFADPADYDRVSQNDELEIAGARAALSGSNTLSVKNKTKGYTFEVKHNLTDRQIEILLDGGMLNYTKKNQ
jgi:aconitate hydratase